MLLAIDVGNTNVTLGVYAYANLFMEPLRIKSDSERLVDEYAVHVIGLLRLRGIEPSSIDNAVIASVVPALTPVFEELCRRYFNVVPLRVGAGVRTGLKVLYDDPREVGADRIVDAVAGLRLHPPPLIIVDVGTATVFDAISREGDYLGGAIAPGLGLAFDVLAQRAAMLRRVDLRPPRHAIGNSTTTSLQSGMVFGWVDLIEGMVARFKAEVGADAWVIGTGGWSALLGPLSNVFDHVDLNLTLMGLRIVWELNQDGNA